MCATFLYPLQALVIDGKLQSAETDEFIYHECLVHPALLHNPKYVLCTKIIQDMEIDTVLFVYLFISLPFVSHV